MTPLLKLSQGIDAMTAFVGDRRLLAGAGR